MRLLSIILTIFLSSAGLAAPLPLSEPEASVVAHAEASAVTAQCFGGGCKGFPWKRDKERDIVPRATVLAAERATPSSVEAECFGGGCKGFPWKA
ncbi:hypothetical protein IAR55_000809 [Kwoniella newhampshirensis]|uniref:Uncharacterized protein n=1 Tax=Kwoniella newhampshirensis TaxID=1651941 RepID=A0AAW0Z447_9TREE